MTFARRSVISQVFGVPGLVFGLFGLVGLVFATVGWFSHRGGQDFAAHGVNVLGQVEARWQSTRDCKDSNSNTTRTCTDFNIGYGYEVMGKVWHDTVTTDYQSYANLAEGLPVMVRYLPSDPGDSVTSLQAGWVDASGGLRVVGLVFGGLGGVFVPLGFGGLAWLVRGALRRTALRDTGTARGAVVLAREPTNVTVNGRSQWRIRWTDDAGALGQSRGQSPDSLPQTGDRITVYADPTGRLPAVWEGDSGSR